MRRLNWTAIVVAAIGIIPAVWGVYSADRREADRNRYNALWRADSIRIAYLAERTAQVDSRPIQTPRRARGGPAAAAPAERGLTVGIIEARAQADSAVAVESLTVRPTLAERLAGARPVLLRSGK